MVDHLRLYANAYRAAFWVVMLPISTLTGWINSVGFVAYLSLWALVEGAWATHRGRMAQHEAENGAGRPGRAGGGGMSGRPPAR